PSVFSKPSAMQESAQQAFLRANHLTGSTRSNEPLKMACGATRKAMDSPSRWPRTLLSRRNVDDDFVPIKCRVAFHYTQNKNAADREIGNAVKLIKHYAEVREELALEIGLHLGLRPGQERSDGVINQMQRKIDSLAIP